MRVLLHFFPESREVVGDESGVTAAEAGHRAHRGQRPPAAGPGSAFIVAGRGGRDRRGGPANSSSFPRPISAQSSESCSHTRRPECGIGRTSRAVVRSKRCRSTPSPAPSATRESPSTCCATGGLGGVRLFHAVAEPTKPAEHVSALFMWSSPQFESTESHRRSRRHQSPRSRNEIHSWPLIATPSALRPKPDGPLLLMNSAVTPRKVQHRSRYELQNGHAAAPSKRRRR